MYSNVRHQEATLEPRGRAARARTSPAGSHGSPASPSAAPPASRAATGAKMSRPWNVADTGGSANGERPMSTASTTPPARSAASDSSPLSGPTSNRPSASPQRDAAPVASDARIDHSEMHAHREVRQRATQDQRPGRTSPRGTQCTRSITRASGQMPAITAWQTPTKSSAIREP